MFGLITGALIFGVVGFREWTKNKDVSVEKLLEETPFESESMNNPKKEVDLTDFLQGVDKGTYVIQELIDTDPWFDCKDRQKLCVVSDGKRVAIDVILPDYTKRTCIPKIADYMRCISDWRRSLNYNSSIGTKLQATYVENDETKYLIIPDSVTEDFGDDRDPKGTNRFFEAVSLNQNRDHNKAVDALNSLLGNVKVKRLDVIVSVGFGGIDNADLGEILGTPLVISRGDTEVATENILFCTSPGNFLDFNDEGNVEEFCEIFED